MTYSDLRVLWALIDRADGRLEFQSCLYTPGQGDPWSVWVGDRTRGIAASYRDLTAFVAHYPSVLLVAPAHAELLAPRGAMSRAEIWRAMDILDTRVMRTYQDVERTLCR